MKKIAVKISHGIEWIIFLTLLGLSIDFGLSMFFKIEMSQLTIFTAIIYSFIGYSHLGEPYEPIKIFEIIYKKVEKESFESRTFQYFIFGISIIVGLVFFGISWILC